MKEKTKNWLRWVGPGLLVLILDRLVKWVHWLVNDSFNLDMRENLSEAPLYYQLLVKGSDGLGKFFSLFQGPNAAVQSDTVKNTGMAFGLFQGNAVGILIVSVALVIVGIFLLRGMRPSGLAPIALSLILGGAVGNMIDRLAFGYVRDMIPFFNWFEFNIADVGVVAGTILCGWSLLFRPQDWSKKEQ